jgi:hypothetical protein
MSVLAWVDFDAVERDRARRILDLFSERETRDELGLGAVRDAIADHLFPGTSTIQTRLRYMLFVPWCFEAAASAGGLRTAMDASRQREIALIEALKAGGETQGVIGREAGARLRRLPSEIYWSGLRTWGMRRIGGGREDYFRAAIARTPEDPPLWSPNLPAAPDDLLERASFALSREEADFLTDRIATSCPESLLAVLARKGDAAECEQIWEHPSRSVFPDQIQTLVAHAETFSAVMLGASLLYNLMLAEMVERVESAEWVERYRMRLSDWQAGLDHGALRAWDLSAFWNAARHEAHSQTPALRRFVQDWVVEALAPGDLADRESARRLVEARERALKGAQSRFRNKSARDRWGGASGAFRLNFRWPVARSHLRDLAHAQ